MKSVPDFTDKREGLLDISHNWKEYGLSPLTPILCSYLMNFDPVTPAECNPEDCLTSEDIAVALSPMGAIDPRDVSIVMLSVGFQCCLVAGEMMWLLRPVNFAPPLLIFLANKIDYFSNAS